MNNPTEADRAKAREIITAIYGPDDWDAGIVGPIFDRIAEALANRYAEGRRQMREEAARIAHREMNRYADNALDDWAMRCAQAASDIEDAIRSLPDHPETSAPVKED